MAANMHLKKTQDKWSRFARMCSAMFGENQM